MGSIYTFSCSLFSLLSFVSVAPKTLGSVYPISQTPQLVLLVPEDNMSHDVCIVGMVRADVREENRTVITWVVSGLC